MKKVNEKGFTLAELLIVVAIIAILVAISIPTFSDQMERSREAVDISNLRGAYSEAVTKILTIPTKIYPVSLSFKQQAAGWTTDTSDLPFKLPVDAATEEISFTPTVTDGAKTLFFVKADANKDDVTVYLAGKNGAAPTPLPDGVTIPAYSYEGTPPTLNLKVGSDKITGTGNKAATTISFEFSKLYNDLLDLSDPVSVAAIDFGEIQGLEYKDKTDTNGKIIGFEISGKPKNAPTENQTVTAYILDKNGVLGAYKIADNNLTVTGRNG